MLSALAGRTVQSIISKGTAAHKKEVVAELTGRFKDMCMSKYGRRVIVKLLQEAGKGADGRTIRAPVFAALAGFTRKLLTHKVRANAAGVRIHRP
jgi:hypothetical protein